MRAALRQLRDLFPLTPGGALLLGLAAWGFRSYGLDRADRIALAAGGIGLALGAIAVLLVVGTAVGLRLALRGLEASAPLELEVGRSGPTGFSVLHPWFVPLVALDWCWVDPPAAVTTTHADGRLHETVRATRRGEYTRVVRRFEVADLVGFARVRFEVPEARMARFVPGTGRLEHVAAVQGMAGGDVVAHPEGPPVGDRLDLRAYAPGDPIRYVLWKVFARSRELVVRHHENALAPAQQTVAYLVAGDADEPAAGAARVALRCGALGTDWAFGADGHAGEVSSLPDAMSMIVRSGQVAPDRGGEGLGAFLQSGTRGGVRRAVLFVPATPGPWLDRVQEALATAGRSTAVEFLVCTDHAERAQKSGTLRRFLLRADAAEAPPSGLSEVLGRLGRGGARVSVVDRAGGRVLPAAALGVRR